MARRQRFEWAIEEIIAAHPRLYFKHHVAMAVAAMSNGTGTTCDFRVECRGHIPSGLSEEQSFALRISWHAESAAEASAILRTEQAAPVVERAAVALAALLFAKLVTGCEMRVADEGERADYFLRNVRCALEVSGTRRPRELRRRHREKVAQVLANPARWPGYVVVCCFSESQKTIIWSYREQTEAMR